MWDVKRRRKVPAAIPWRSRSARSGIRGWPFVQGDEQLVDQVERLLHGVFVVARRGSRPPATSRRCGPAHASRARRASMRLCAGTRARRSAPRPSPSARRRSPERPAATGRREGQRAARDRIDACIGRRSQPLKLVVDASARPRAWRGSRETRRDRRSACSAAVTASPGAVAQW